MNTIGALRELQAMLDLTDEEQQRLKDMGINFYNPVNFTVPKKRKVKKVVYVEDYRTRLHRIYGVDKYYKEFSL